MFEMIYLVWLMIICIKFLSNKDREDREVIDHILYYFGTLGVATLKRLKNYELK